MSKFNRVKHREIHCTNCTPKDNTRLPDRYETPFKTESPRGIYLCPRCKCPEVSFVNPEFETSNGYNQVIKRKG